MNPLFALLLVSVGHFFCDFMIGIWPLYKTLVGIDLLYAGLIYSLSAVIGEGSQLFFGSMSDRRGRNKIILFGLLLTSASLWMITSNNLIALFLLFLMTCLGSGAFHPAASGLVARLTSTNKSLFMTFFATFGFLGMALSQTIFMQVYTISPLFIPLLSFPLLFFLLLIPTLPKIENVNKEPFSLKIFSHFFCHKGLRNLYILQVAISSISWAMVFLLPELLRSRGHENWLVYGGGHLIYILGGALMLIPSGLLADRFSARRVIQGAVLLATIFFFTLLLNPSYSTTTVAPILFCLGASIALINPLSIALGAKVVPHRVGSISAFLMGGVWAVSEVVGPGGGALLSTLFETDGPGKALLLLGLFFPIGLTACFFLPEEVADDSIALLKYSSNE